MENIFTILRKFHALETNKMRSLDEHEIKINEKSAGKFKSYINCKFLFAL